MAHSKGESHYLFGKHLPEETKAKIRASVIETLKNPEIRKKLGDSHRGKPSCRKGKFHTEESKRKMSESLKGKRVSEETKKHLSEINNGENHPQYGSHRSEETKRKLSISQKERFANKANHPMFGKHHSQKSIEKMSGENNHGWQGGISKLPYCKLWNASLKERVRIFFSYQCVECGTPQGKKKLDVHHIHYDKKSCCNNEAPRMFVALCHSCHTKTEVNRSYWEEHFTEIIQKYYQGKCFFTKEEMAQFQEMI